MKRTLLLALLLASVAFAGYPNFAARWRFQNSGLDCSGFGHNLTVNGTGAFANARGQRVLYFDGTGDYCSLSGFALSGSVVWVAFWTRSKTYAADIQCFIGDNAASSTVGYLRFQRNANSSNVIFYYAEGTSNSRGAQYLSYFAGAYNDAWVFVSVICDYTGKVIYWYRNGVYLSSTAMANTPVFPSTSRTRYVGSYSTTAYLLQDSYLGDFRWGTLAAYPGRAIADASVARLYAGGMPTW